MTRGARAKPPCPRSSRGGHLIAHLLCPDKQGTVTVTTNLAPQPNDSDSNSNSDSNDRTTTKIADTQKPKNTRGKIHTGTNQPDKSKAQKKRHRRPIAQLRAALSVSFAQLISQVAGLLAVSEVFCASAAAMQGKKTTGRQAGRQRGSGKKQSLTIVGAGISLSLSLSLPIYLSLEPTILENAADDRCCCCRSLRTGWTRLDSTRLDWSVNGIADDAPRLLLTAVAAALVNRDGDQDDDDDE
ncbi:hypothetical protein BKA81DRAFT_379171 [Phyllosticta paracitricarpa]